MAKGRKGRRGSKRLAKNTQKMMKSCMYGGDSAVTGLAGSGATGYGAAIYGAANAQTTNGMGSNNIKMNDPALVWKGGQRGGANITSGTVVFTTETDIPGQITLGKIPANTTLTIGPNVTVVGEVAAGADTAGVTVGGSMLGAAIVPAVLLAANQLYKPSRALKNLSFSRKSGMRKTMKKFGKRRR